MAGVKWVEDKSAVEWRTLNLSVRAINEGDSCGKVTTRGGTETVTGDT